DEQPAVTRGVAGDAVSAAADRHHELVVARELDRPNHVGLASTAGDERRLLVDHRVPDTPRLVVAWLARCEQLAMQRGPEMADRSGIQHLMLVCRYHAASVEPDGARRIARTGDRVRRPRWSPG